KFVNISLGQVVRNLQSEIEINEQQVIKKWNKEIVESLKSCSVKQLPPLGTTKALFDNLSDSLPEGKSVLLDGLPREIDQVPMVTDKSARLGREGYNVIVLVIDLADDILDARIEARRICPKCGFVDGTLTPIINTVEHDSGDNKFYLVCPKCQVRMVRKKGDQLSKEIYERREKTEKTMRLLREQLPPEQLIYLRTDVSVNEFEGSNEDLNLSVEHSLDAEGNIITKREPLIANWQGKKVYSLSPKGGVVEIIKHLAEKVC
ncbi:hypothetical protein KKB83_01615, partial [Patescibacteria group bacterium]|nr:hypothetical protein [Patescibacteria group bacterium]